MSGCASHWGLHLLAEGQGKTAVPMQNKEVSREVTLMTDADGSYYTNVVIHDHPTHDDVVKAMRRRQELRLAAKARSSQHTPTQQVAIDVRLKTKTSRRLSTDTRFIRRIRQNGHPPKTPREIPGCRPLNHLFSFGMHRCCL